MTKRGISKRNRDGISVEDKWATTGHRRGAHWIFKVRDPNLRTYIRQAFSDEAAGWSWAKDMQAKVRLGQDGAGKAHTATVAKEYVQGLTDLKRHDHHIREVKRVLNSLSTSGATDLKARDFRAKVEHWRRTLKASKTDDKGRIRRQEVFELAPVTVNRYLLHVRSLVSYAVDSGYISRNPLGRIKSLEEGDRIKATFTIAELQSLVALRAYDNPAWLWAVLMAFTGCRSQEALHLRWEWVDIAAGTVSVRLHPDYDLKRDKERSIPLQPVLAGILGKYPNRPDLGWIVSGTFRSAKPSTLSDALKRTLHAAGIVIGDRTPHSFRHTFASIMVATGQHVFDTCRALGHSDLKMTEHYSREAASHRATIEREGWKPGELRLTLPAVVGGVG